MRTSRTMPRRNACNVLLVLLLSLCSSSVTQAMRSFHATSGIVTTFGENKVHTFHLETLRQSCALAHAARLQLLFTVGVFIVGSDAAPFTGRAELKTAVDNCLEVDTTGAACCNIGAGSADCGPAGNAELSEWDVSSVTNMNELFRGASSFNADISDWDVSAVTNMRHMFSDASAFNVDISDWDIRKVTDLSYTFYSAYAFNADISKWDVRAVTDMSYAFAYASSTTCFCVVACSFHLIPSSAVCSPL